MAKRFPKVSILESTQSVKLECDGRIFKAQVYGAGNNPTVEIDEIDKTTGMHFGHRNSYRVPGRLVWRVAIARYVEDRKKAVIR